MEYRVPRMPDPSWQNDDGGRKKKKKKERKERKGEEESKAGPRHTANVGCIYRRKSSTYVSLRGCSSVRPPLSNKAWALGLSSLGRER